MRTWLTPKLSSMDSCTNASKLRRPAPWRGRVVERDAARANTISGLGLQQQPLDIYVDNRLYGLLDDKALLYDAIPTALRKPATWPMLADNLAKWLDGNATEAFLAYGTQTTMAVRWRCGAFRHVE